MNTITRTQFLAEQKRRSMKAKELLLSLLTDNQRWHLRYRGVIPVTSNTGENWRIMTSGITVNVLRERNRRGYCAGLREYPIRGELAQIPSPYDRSVMYTDSYRVPHADFWIAQLLTLQTDQVAFLHVAHAYSSVPREAPLPGDKGNRVDTSW